MEDTNLHNIKSTGFKTPDAYFELFEDSFFSKLKEHNIASKIDSNGFIVPEHYFETFDNKVLKTISENDTSKVVPVFTWRKAAYMTGIAASVILAINLFFTDSSKLTFDDLETASIESYLINEDMNAYDIVPFLDITDLTSEDFVETSLTTSDIEDYLLQNSDVEHLITD